MNPFDHARWTLIRGALANLERDLATDVEIGDLSGEPGALLRDARAHLVDAIVALEELELSLPLAAEVAALAELCACGRDRGEHMTEAPHPSEDGACAGFARPRRDTLIDSNETDPAPAPMGAA